MTNKLKRRGVATKTLAKVVSRVTAQEHNVLLMRRGFVAPSTLKLISKAEGHNALDEQLLAMEAQFIKRFNAENKTKTKIIQALKSKTRKSR